jgi:hypothetical protein
MDPSHSGSTDYACRGYNPGNLQRYIIDKTMLVFFSCLMALDLEPWYTPG